MSPSPEPGQPKAPDKTSSSSSSSSLSSRGNLSSSDGPYSNDNSLSAATATATLESTSPSTSSTSISSPPQPPPPPEISSILSSSISQTSSSSASSITSNMFNNNNNSSNNNNNKSCYHQYTTSASMTHTTTTQSHSGTLVSTGATISSGSLPLSTTVYSTNPSSNSNTVTSAVTSSTTDMEQPNTDWTKMGDNQLKELLDEAYTYRIPKDRKKMSKTFRNLLHKAEIENEECDPFPFGLEIPNVRGSNSRKHGGSLQDLLATQSDALFEVDYNNPRPRRHHHNSRSKKYSLVSTRPREGGSLPSNVNVSNCNLSVYEPSFLNEVNKRRGKSERTCSGTSYTSGISGTSSTVSTCGYESLSSSSTSQTNNNKDDSSSSTSSHFTIATSGDTIIDMGDSFVDNDVHIQHHLANDRLAQGLSEPLEHDDGIELSVVNKKNRNSVNALNRIEITCSEPKPWVDEQVSFSALERSTKHVDSSCLPLNDKCYDTLLGCDKSEVIKTPTAIFAQSKTARYYDENGNALTSTSFGTSSTSQLQPKTKKNRKSQSDRNMTTLNLQLVAGYRGEDSVEELVRFIESTTTDSTKKNDKNIKQEGKRKEKKKDKEKEKDEKKKLKRSNSLEELRSCTKLDEDDKQDGHVTMRNKSGKKNSTDKMSITNNIEGKENIKQQQNQKRGERRSWGTEELSYLGENNAIEEVREKVKEKEKSKKSKDTKENKDSKEINKEKEVNDKVEKIEKSEKFEKFDKFEKDHNKKKKDEHTAVSIASVESMQNESAEFHVVTKKKKPKKRQTFDGTSVTLSMGSNLKSTGNTSSGSGNRGDNNSYMSSGSRRYRASSHFTNDRDLYLNSLNANESRRKSTSSVPPSEKSDSSDLDSVHSLPIEASSSRHISHSSNNNMINGGANSMTSSSMSASNQMQPQSYADIARIVNLNKANSSTIMMNTTSNDKNEKWPSVQSHSGNSSDNSTYSNTSGIVSSKKKSQHKDFPNLISDKSINQNNDAGSSCSSTSSTSTIVKQVTYSQSLGDEKHINDDVTVINKTTTSKSSRLTDVFKNITDGNTTNKKTLHKSKSIEMGTYCNFEQYPALEKTIKRHTQQQQQHPQQQQQNNNNTIVTTANPNQLNTGNSKQQRSSANMNHILNPTSTNQNTSQSLSNNNNNSQNVITDASQQHQNQQQQQLMSSIMSQPNDKSKLYNHNLDISINSNLASTSSLSNNNLNSMNNINGSINTIANTAINNNGKKLYKNQQQSVTNKDQLSSAAVAADSSVATQINVTSLQQQTQQQQQQIIGNSPLVEINNAKNKQQIINQNVSTTNSTDVINTNATNNKRMKFDSLQTSSTFTSGRRSKRDKNNQNNQNNNNNNNNGHSNNKNQNSKNISEAIVDLQQFPPLTSSPSSSSSSSTTTITTASTTSSSTTTTALSSSSSSSNSNSISSNSCNKYSNRPAVIILNDVINDNSVSIVNDFTFGDFNEDELRLFENHVPFNDSDQFNITTSSSYQDVINNNDDIASYLSPHDSDHEYSSSSLNNRSTFSESVDDSYNNNNNNSNISNKSSSLKSTIQTSSNNNNYRNKIQGSAIDIVAVDSKRIQRLSGIPVVGNDESYYIEKISNTLPNGINTQNQTKFYQQQQPQSPSIRQKIQTKTNLGIQVDDVVPITIASTQTPIGNNNLQISTNISNSGSSGNDTKNLTKIFNCKCIKNNNNNDDVGDIIKQTNILSDIADNDYDSTTATVKISSTAAATTTIITTTDNTTSIVTVVNLKDSSNSNNNNASNKINKNIVIKNNNGEIVTSYQKIKQHQHQQQQEISPTTNVIDSSGSGSCSISGNFNKSTSRNKEQILGNNNKISSTMNLSLSSSSSSSTTTPTLTPTTPTIDDKLNVLKSNSNDNDDISITDETNEENTSFNVISSSPALNLNQNVTTNCENNNRKKLTSREINVCFIAPPIANELNPNNYEKIVDFVGLAWQEISGTNRGAQFYNGQ